MSFANEKIRSTFGNLAADMPFKTQRTQTQHTRPDEVVKFPSRDPLLSRHYLQSV